MLLDLQNKHLRSCLLLPNYSVENEREDEIDLMEVETEKDKLRNKYASDITDSVETL